VNEKRVCGVCESGFIPDRSNYWTQRYCSRRCRNAAARRVGTLDAQQIRIQRAISDNAKRSLAASDLATFFRISRQPLTHTARLMRAA